MDCPAVSAHLPAMLLRDLALAAAFDALVSGDQAQKYIAAVCGHMRARGVRERQDMRAVHVLQQTTHV